MSRDLLHKINIQSSLDRSTVLNKVQVGLTKILKQLKEAVLLFFKSKNFLFYYYIVTIMKKKMGVEKGTGSVLRLSRVKP